MVLCLQLLLSAASNSGLIAHVSCHSSQNLHLGSVVTLTPTRLGIWQSLLRAPNSDLDPKVEEDIKYVKTLFTCYQHIFF